MFVHRGLILLLAAAGFRPTAQAADALITITGTVQWGVDSSGVFGPPNTDLSGQSFTVTYRFDDTKGSPFVDTCDDGEIFGSGIGDTASSTQSNTGVAFITINGRSFQLGTGRLGETSVTSSAQVVLPGCGSPRNYGSFNVNAVNTGDGYSGGSFISTNGGISPAPDTTLTADPHWEHSFSNSNLDGVSALTLNIGIAFLPPGASQYQDVADVSASLLPSSITVTGPSTPCDICSRIASQSQTSDGQAESLRLCYMLFGALKELGDYRAAFLSNFDFINLFPTVYYDVTQLEMQRLAAGTTFAHPIEHMQEMLAFFDAYKFNRDIWNAGGIAEPHWQAAFVAAFAADMNPAMLTAIDIQNVLTAAINAHVQYDLARALSYSFNHNFESNLTPDDLQPDFLASNQTLQDSAATAATDIYNAVNASGSSTAFLWPLFQQAWDAFRGITRGVIAMRQQAWSAGLTGNLPRDLDDSALIAQPLSNDGFLETEGTASCRVTP